MNLSKISNTSFRDLRVLPIRCSLLISALSIRPWSSCEDLAESADVREEMALPRYVRDNMSILLDLGLVHSQVAQRVARYELTELGRRLSSEQGTRPSLYTDVIHYLCYSLCDDQRRAGTIMSGWSWVYQTACRLLWEERPEVPTFPEMAAALNRELLVLDPEFSGGVHRNSANAAQVWLRQLDPPFLYTQFKPWRSQGRDWCSPELVVLAFAHIYRLDELPYDTPLLIDDHVWRELCACCLVEQPLLEEVLEVAVGTFPYIEMHSGEWGRSLIAHQPITVLDLL